MEATFRFDGVNIIRVGNNIAPDQAMAQPHGYIGLVWSQDLPRQAGEPMVTWFASMRPHEARSLASVLMASVAEASDRR